CAINYMIRVSITYHRLQIVLQCIPSQKRQHSTRDSCTFCSLHPCIILHVPLKLNAVTSCYSVVVGLIALCKVCVGHRRSIVPFAVLRS
ncbi:hypothetical protein PENTCL1PPCAC_13284, partial [Pristionchus entomophagus]